MENEAIHKKFLEALEIANNTDVLLPVDVKLKFYAYYKQSTESTGLYQPSDEIQMRNSFKINAILQVQHLSKDEAKQKYIELVSRYLNKD